MYPNSTGAEIRSVSTKAGMFAIRACQKTVTEKDFLKAVKKVIKSNAKCCATYIQLSSKGIIETFILISITSFI